MFSACGKKGPKDYIVNKWRITDVNPSTPYSESLKKATLEFKKDNTWALTGTPAADQAGMYTMSDDYRQLTTTDVRGEKSELTLHEVSKEQIIFTDKKTGIKFWAVPK